MIEGPPRLPDRPARLLIVDDEPHNRSVLEIMLSPAGYQIQMAAGGREALAMISSERPDLILLDVMMPDMDGYQVAAAIKHSPLTRNIPIILVTALDDRDSRAGLSLEPTSLSTTDRSSRMARCAGCRAPAAFN